MLGLAEPLSERWRDGSDAFRSCADPPVVPKRAALPPARCTRSARKARIELALHGEGVLASECPVAPRGPGPAGRARLDPRSGEVSRHLAGHGPTARPAGGPAGTEPADRAGPRLARGAA